MPYTSHGHPYGLMDTDQPRPGAVARCGGPKVCSQCAREAAHVCVLAPPAEPTAVHDLAQAIRLTRDYVGHDLLPALDGWSWYDALKKHAPEFLVEATSVEPAQDQDSEQAACKCGYRAPELGPHPDCPHHGEQWATAQAAELTDARRDAEKVIRNAIDNALSDWVGMGERLPELDDDQLPAVEREMKAVRLTWAQDAEQAGDGRATSPSMKPARPYRPGRTDR